MNLCKKCKTPFEPSKYRRDHSYCSKQCYNTVYLKNYNKTGKRARVNLPKTKCPGCNKKSNRWYKDHIYGKACQSCRYRRVNGIPLIND